MSGTILEAMAAMLLIPLRITAATITTMTMPMMNRSMGVFSMPMGVVNTVATDSTSWLACHTHSVPTSPKIANALASGFHFSPNPLVMMYMGPPCTSPALSVPLYMIASVPSKNLVVIPTKALTHIQNITPGLPLPIVSATATPAMLPIPTVAAIALISAWNELIWPVSLPLSEACFCLSTLMACGKRLIDTAPE